MEWGRPDRRTGEGLAAGLRMLAVIAVCAAAVAVGGRSIAQDAVIERREYNVKAVSLYGFGRYTTWPTSAYARDDSPFVIGILGPDPFGGALDHIAAKKAVHDRSMRIERYETASSYTPCQILFVSRKAPEADVAALLARLKGQPVLIVGEVPGFAAGGGVISFYLDAGAVRFHINAAEARERGIRLDAKLLSLAAPAQNAIR